MLNVNKEGHMQKQKKQTNQKKKTVNKPGLEPKQTDQFLNCKVNSNLYWIQIGLRGFSQVLND